MDTSQDDELMRDLLFNLEMLQREGVKIDVKLNPLREQLKAKEDQFRYEKEKLTAAKRRRGATEEVIRRTNSMQAVSKHIERLTEECAHLEEQKKSSVEKIARAMDEIKETQNELSNQQGQRVE